MTRPEPLAGSMVPAPAAGEVARIVASLPRQVHRSALRHVFAGRPGGLGRLAATAHRAESSSPRGQSTPLRPVGPSPALPPPPPTPQPTPPAAPPPASPPVTQAPIGPTPRSQDKSRPGWGYGDRTHDHTGPPGKSQPSEPAPAAGAPGNAHGNHESGEKKSPGR
jgi:hypothetical protein